MRGKRISITRDLPCPNQYVLMMDQEFAPWTYNEEKAPLLRGKWRQSAFGEESARRPLDLEIGTGNGIHFAHRAAALPERLLIGVELKYKPLIQSIRRALRAGAENARAVRYNACLVHELFERGEVDDIFIHFPDPWPRQSQWKHRLISAEFLELLHKLQRPGSKLEFKTDSRCYFDWTVKRLDGSPYKVKSLTYDLHQSPWREENFVTHFEGLFLKQKLPIHRVVLEKSHQ